MSLYYSLIHSHLVYCIQVWSSAQPSVFKNLVKKQKMAIRVIHQTSYNAHTESLFKKSKILPLPPLVDYFKIQFMRQYSLKFLPISLNTAWSTNAERRTGVDPTSLRNDDDLYIHLARLSCTEHHPLISFPKLWNEFPAQDLKLISSKTTFNKSLKDHLLNTLSENYVCNRLLCPRCHLLYFF
jgi:hypothetical protein